MVTGMVHFEIAGGGFGMAFGIRLSESGSLSISLIAALKRLLKVICHKQHNIVSQPQIESIGKWE